jgi:hypothetical protein
MKPVTKLTHEFVEFIPGSRKDGAIYVSLAYATAVHNCCCGCGSKVVTPFSPTDWKLIFDGESISLHPSIGNWSFPCRSHYWIRCNNVVWARRMSKKEIEAGRAHDRIAKEQYYDTLIGATDGAPKDITNKPERSFWKKIRKLWT